MGRSHWCFSRAIVRGGGMAELRLGSAHTTFFGSRFLPEWEFGFCATGSTYQINETDEVSLRYWLAHHEPYINHHAPNVTYQREPAQRAELCYRLCPHAVRGLFARRSRTKGLPVSGGASRPLHRAAPHPGEHMPPVWLRAG